MQEQKEQKTHWIKRVLQRMERAIGSRLPLFRLFDEPRPKYVAHVTPIDKFLNATVLWIFPRWVKPNYVTIFRFISVPFLVFYLLVGNYTVAFPLFVIAAISDALDGALARTRNEITDWGIVFDPFADKLLIGTIGGIMIFKFISPLLAFLIVFFEVILIISSYYRFKGRIVPAKTVGKIKMTLQSVGVSLIFLFILVPYPFILVSATCILYLAVIFEILSIVVYRSI